MVESSPSSQVDNFTNNSVTQSGTCAAKGVVNATSSRIGDDGQQGDDDAVVDNMSSQGSFHTAASMNNPWHVSPAVTMTQSGLSASYTEACSFQAAPSDDALEATVSRTSEVQENPQQLDSSQSQNAQEVDSHETSRAVSPTETCQNHTTQSSQAPSTSSNHPTIDTSFVNTNHDAHSNSATATSTAAQDNTTTGQLEDEEATGGRLWQAAMKEVEKNSSRGGRPTSAKSAEHSRFAESLMERTRSRADPNALVSPGSAATTNQYQQVRGKPSMVTLSENDGSVILSTALAKKRVRVVQLLLIGLLGLLLGLLGNFFVSTSCHFATVDVMVGQNQKVFQFHFGLWKYSPIDSVFQGYSYCYKYDQNYSSDSPIVARVANIVALVAGTLAISVLWVYLIFGNADKRRWKWAVRIAVCAGLVQLSTLYFFFGKLCTEYSCSLGPAAYLSMLTTVVWFVLACEMHYHTPLAVYASYLVGPSSALEEPRSLVTTMEMAHLDDVTREYMTRVTGKTKEDEMPALNTDLKRVRPRSGLYSPTSSRAGSNLYQPSPRGTYQAPMEPSTQIGEQA